jgi:transposase, IS5 family
LAEVVMRRETRQLSLAEALVSGGKSGERLARIFTVLDWPALEGVLCDLRAAPTGRPGYPPLVMLRVLLLAQWYGLSDPELEEALADRLSFRRFAGLRSTARCRTRPRSAASVASSCGAG